MKLDMGAAWNGAMAMLGANRTVVLVVAGVFFFLPYLALALLLPQALQPQAEAADPTAALAILGDIYATYWWAFLLLSIAQGIGLLALLALLTDRSRPTVGEALQWGAKGFLPYIAAQLLLALGLGIVIGLPIAGAAMSGLPLVTFLVGLIGVVFMVYAMIKFSLVAQVIAIDRILNPVAALKRSWLLTKGNSVRLLGFYFLLLLAIGVTSLIVTMIFGVVFAALGGQAELVGNGVVSSAINAVFVVIFMAVLAAVHRQLAGPSAEAVQEVFE